LPPRASAHRCICPANCSRRWPAFNSFTCLSRIGAGPDRRNERPDPGHVRQRDLLVRIHPGRQDTRARRDHARAIGHASGPPPIGETLPGYETSSFFGVGAPHGTPPEIVDLLNKEINAALADPTIKQKLADLGAIPIPKEFAAMPATERSKTLLLIIAASRLVRADIAGIQLHRAMFPSSR
jgi:Tripartite tricarboxylate transporter family receptor